MQNAECRRTGATAREKTYAAREAIGNRPHVARVADDFILEAYRRAGEGEWDLLRPTDGLTEIERTGLAVLLNQHGFDCCNTYRRTWYGCKRPMLRVSWHPHRLPKP